MTDAAAVGVLSHGAGFYTTRRLLEACQAAGHTSWILDPTRVVLQTGAGVPPLLEDGAPLEIPELVLPRIGSTLTDWSLALLEGLTGAGAWSPVTPTALALAQDKLATTQRISAAGLPTLPTVAVRETTHIEDALAAVGGPPVVLKLRRGTQGHHVIGAGDGAAARSMLGSLIALGHTVVMQPWIPMEAPRDLRVLVLGGKAHAACWRHAPPGDFRSNVHRGATTTPAEITPEIADLAARASDGVGLPLCGVDLLPTRDGWAVLEVNGSPGLEGIESATGRDLAGDLLAYVVSAHPTC